MIRPAVEDPEQWGAARCNDGSAATMLLHPGSSKLWVIRVSGGYYCDDRELLCRDRSKRFTSALTEGAEAIPHGGSWSGPHDGLFSRDAGNALSGANQVVLQYCSSDVWLGEHTAASPIKGRSEGMIFAGRHILRAGLEALRGHGFDPTDPEVQVVFVGQSSGAVGLAHNLPLLQELMPDAITQGRVSAVFDGGWIPEVPMRDSFRLNAWGSWMPACEVANAAPEGDPGRCIFGERWYPFWRDAGIEILVLQSGLDLTQLKAMGIDSALGRTTQREVTRKSLEQVPRVVSGGWSYHVIAFDPRVDSTAFGALIRDEVRRLLARGEPERVFYRYEEAP